MKTIALLSSFAGAAFGSSSIGVSFDVDSVAATASVRSYTFTNQTDRVLITGAAWDVDSGSKSGSLDAAAFGIQAGLGDGVEFYFGTLSASGTYSVSANSLASSYTGSLSEMAVSFKGLAPYINKDGNDGFQYTVDADHFSCDAAGVDCLADYTGSFLDFSYIGWGPISITKADCSADPNAVTTTDCAVYKFSTSTTGTASVRFDMYITTQPVNLDGDVTVTPDDLKLDLTYTFPAANYPASCGGNCGVAVVAVAGGKATSGDGVVQYNGDGSVDGHSTFQTDSGKATYFSWTSDVTVGGTASTMYSSIITGSDVAEINSKCQDAFYALDHFIACIFARTWDTIYLTYDAFGWQLRLYFFSTAEINPGTVVWDPQIGGTDCDSDASNPVCSSGASSLLPLLALLLLQ